MHRSRIWLACLPVVAALVLSASGSPPAAIGQDGSAVVPSPADRTRPPDADPLEGIEILVAGERDPDLQVPEADLRALVRGNTAFALDLYREVADEPGNLVLGPLSISVAIAMNHVGARGDTASQTARALHFRLPGERLDAAFDQLHRDLEALAGPGLTLSLVSQLFGQQGYAFKQPFLETLGQHFGAPLAVVDFASDAEAVRARINRWVALQTADRIPDLIPPDRLTDLTRLVFVNAMYLKADWAIPFNAAVTEDRPFRLHSGRTVDVPTMGRTVTAPVVVRSGYRAIELPYVDDRLAMLIVVPRDIEGFESSLTPRRLEGIVGRLNEDVVALTLPTFSARSAIDLAGPLQALGMVDAFLPGRADLSGISDEAGLHVSTAVHQAFIKVAEQGTEAAAATAVGDSGTSGPPSAFEVDRPFLWFIRDRETGSVLFLGRVTDPAATAD